MVFKITFVPFIKFQSYCISKEFAFKDQKNNNMEMKPSACSHAGSWIVFHKFLPQACTARAQTSRPPVTHINNSWVERSKGCGGELEGGGKEMWILLTPKQGLVLHLLGSCFTLMTHLAS